MTRYVRNNTNTTFRLPSGHTLPARETVPMANATLNGPSNRDYVAGLYNSGKVQDADAGSAEGPAQGILPGLGLGTGPAQAPQAPKAGPTPPPQAKLRQLGHAGPVVPGYSPSRAEILAANLTTLRGWADQTGLQNYDALNDTDLAALLVTYLYGEHSDGDV